MELHIYTEYLKYNAKLCSKPKTGWEGTFVQVHRTYVYSTSYTNFPGHLAHFTISLVDKYEYMTQVLPLFYALCDK